MPAIQQYALLIVVVLPVAVLVAMNVFLAFFGERGTLLLPRSARYPRIELEGGPAPQAALEESATIAVEVEPLRKAA